MKTFLVAFCLGFLGTSFIAEQTVPGDLLYPLKISVNERFKHALAVGSKAEAKLALSLLRERIREATQLADQDRLTPDLANELQDNIAKAAIEVQVQYSESSPTSPSKPAEVAETLSDLKTALLRYKEESKVLDETLDMVEETVLSLDNEDMTVPEADSVAVDLATTTALDLLEGVGEATNASGTEVQILDPIEVATSSENNDLENTNATTSETVVEEPTSLF